MFSKIVLDSMSNCLVANYPSNIYLIKVNNRNIRKKFEISPKLTIKTPEKGR